MEFALTLGLGKNQERGYLGTCPDIGTWKNSKEKQLDLEKIMQTKNEKRKRGKRGQIRKFQPDNWNRFHAVTHLNRF